MGWVRKRYGVPAKRGGRILYTGCGHRWPGTIMSSSGGYINVKLDGRKHASPFHPTWEIEYLTEVPRP